MPMTMTQKILADHAGLESVAPGDLIEAKLDYVLGNDVTTPPAIKVFEKLGVKDVFDKDRVLLIQDHFTPNKDIKSAELNKAMRCFAREQEITHYYELGRKEMGIEHVILPDNGIVLPGDLVIGADSHTCTYGALGSFATGVGSTDLACAMARGVTWFKVPEAIRINLSGRFKKFVTGKDLILSIIGRIGVDGALYKSLEFAGEGIKELSMDQRLTVCNMAIECGAKNGIFPVDNYTLKYISRTNPERFIKSDYKVYMPDDDAEYSQVIDIDLNDIELTVTWFKVPEAIRINLSGRFKKFVTGKDLILSIIGRIGVDGALYKSLEFAGEGIKELSMDQRLTVCNMAIECGAKNGIFPVDNYTLKYISRTNPERFIKSDYKVYMPDDDAEYSQVIDIDLNDIELTVALPHLPSNTKNAADCKDMKIDQVVIGSCTNGRLEDIGAAATIFQGLKVHKDVRCIVIPGSQKVYRQALDNGWLQILDDAGCVISTPTCGPCLGGHMGVLAKGERCVSTTNRNFVGRMGDVESEVILSGVPVAAASAVLGRVGTPDEL